MENIIVAFIVCFAAYFAGRKLLGPTIKKKSGCGCGCNMSDHCATDTCNEPGQEETR